MKPVSRRTIPMIILVTFLISVSCSLEIHIPLTRLSVNDMKTKTGKAAVLTVNAAIDVMNASGNSGETLIDIMRNIENTPGMYEDIVSGYRQSLSELDESADLETIALDEISELVRSGMTEEEAVRLIQEDVGRLSASDRGIYLREGITNLTYMSGRRWKDGVVRYYFDGMSDRAKAIIRQAMNDWEEKTGFVKFVETDYCFGEEICALLGQYECLRIVNNDGEGCSNSTVGAGINKHMKICERGNDESLLRTARHELGHVLGLYHEHQRYDRDEYVIVGPGDGNTINSGRIPQDSVCFGYSLIRLPLLSIYVPYVWYGQFSYTVGEFDFDSIMLYPGLLITDEYACPENGDYYSPGVWRTRFNHDISENDVLAVRRMYGME